MPAAKKKTAKKAAKMKDMSAGKRGAKVKGGLITVRKAGDKPLE